MILLYLVLLIMFIAIYLGWKLDSDNQFILTPYIIFNTFIVFTFITSMIAFDNVSNYSYNPSIASFLSFIFFNVGYFILIRFSKKSLTKAEKFKKKEFSDSLIFLNNYRYPAFLIIIVLIAIGIYLYKGMPPIYNSIVSLFGGDLSYDQARGTTLFRQQITKSHYFGGEYKGQGMFRVILRIGWSYLAAVYFVLYLRKNNNKIFHKSLIPLSIILVLTLGFVGGDGTRLPLIEIIIHMIVIFTIMRDVKLKDIIIVFSVIIMLVTMLSFTSIKMYNLYAGSSSIFINSFKSIIERIVMGNAINDVLTVNYVDRGIIDYQLGKIQFTQFMNSFPGVQYGLPFSNILGQIHGSNTTTYLSTTYLGISYAEFGMIGVVISHFFIGIIVSVVSNLMYQMKKNVLTLSLISFLIFRVGYIQMTGLVGSLVSIMMVLAIHVFFKTTIDVLWKITNKRSNLHNIY